MGRYAPNRPFLIAVDIDGIGLAPFPAAVAAETVVQYVFGKIRTGPGSDFHMFFLWPDRAQVGNGSGENFGDFPVAQSKILRMDPGRKGPDRDACHGFDIIEGPQYVYIAAVHPQFFHSLPYGCVEGTGIAFFDAPAGKADVPRLPGQFAAPHFKQDMFFPTDGEDRQDDGTGRIIEG